MPVTLFLLCSINAILRNILILMTPSPSSLNAHLIILLLYNLVVVIVEVLGHSTIVRDISHGLLIIVINELIIMR